MTKERCPACGGSGEPPNPHVCDWSHCPECGGTGRVDADRLADEWENPHLSDPPGFAAREFPF